MFEKHLWKSDILSKDAGRYLNVHPPLVFFKHFASKNQLPGLSVSGTLGENELTTNSDYIALANNSLDNEL